MAEVLLIHHIQGLTDGGGGVRRRPAGGWIPCTPDLHDGTPSPIEEGFASRRRRRRWRSSTASARLPGQAAVRRLLLGCLRAPSGSPRPVPARRGAALRVLHPDQRRVGVRAVARRSAGADPRQGGRRVLRGGPARGSRAGRDGRGETWPSSSCTTATRTCSPTAACRRTTARRPRPAPHPGVPDRVWATSANASRVLARVFAAGMVALVAALLVEVDRRATTPGATPR